MISMKASELKKALVQMNKVVKKSHQKPIMRRIRIWCESGKGKEKFLKMQGSNLDQSLTVTIAGVQDGKALKERLIVLEDLRAFVKGAKGGEIGFHSEDEGLLVSVGSLSRSLCSAGAEPKDYPVIPMAATEKESVAIAAVESSSLQEAVMDTTLVQASGDTRYALNGTLKPLVDEYGFKYTGLDIAPGPNVDVVANSSYAYPYEAGVFDLVISNATLEHIKFKEVWIQELTRVCAIGGLVILMNPTCMAYHASEVDHHPVDYWRVLPDGMKYLMEEVAGLVDVTVGHDDVYCWGIGVK